MIRCVFLLASAAALAAQTPSDCRELVRLGKRQAAALCFEKLTRAPVPAVRAEGFWGLGNYNAANDQFKAAVAAQPKNADLKARWGRLYLDRFQPVDAKELFNEALAVRADHPGALLGMALAAAVSFERSAQEFAARAAQADPGLVEARELLARLALEDGNVAGAIAESDRAFAIRPDALGAMAVRASIDLLENKGTSPWFDRIAKHNPACGEAYETAGHFLVINRRYEEGIAMFRKAIELTPELQSARSQLGINLMRLGRDAEAREALEQAYEAGHKDAPTVNSLRLIDTYSRFETFTTPKIEIKLDRKEAAVLRPYFEAELERAVATYERKYKLQLGKRVRLEVYPNHADFEVRTVGLPHLAALGVAFGDVVAMDSPSGRPPGAFHWASTLWHELSHVYVLTATKHRVPRWFTEGMAVHEETAASPEWGDRLDPEVLRAIREKKLLPVETLDRGFVRPSYPAQVTVSYFQAGRICDYIAETWGYDKLLEMMRLFGESRSTPDVVRTALAMEPEQFDRQFLAWIDKQTGKTAAGFSAWQKQYKELLAAARAKKHDEVIALAPAVISGYADMVEKDSAYELLAAALLDKGDKTGAAAQLETYAQTGGRRPESLLQLARLQTELGQEKQAIRTLERLILVYPLNEELHKRLGDLYLTNDSAALAVREFTALVASRPADEAGARYDLARALRKAQRTEEAKEQLLLALESAPGFKPAQKMLLEMSN